jgi:dienelactone hydrolase
VRCRQLLVFFFVAACAAPIAPDPSVEVAGPFGVGTARWLSVGGGRSRDLPVTAWYPSTATAGAAVAVTELETEPHRTTWSQLLAASPSCTQRQHVAVQGGSLAEGVFPLVMMSHCYNCNRFDLLSQAQRLASHGFIVVAVDHLGDTWWDHLAGNDVMINRARLDIRTADIQQVLDGVLDRIEAPPALTAAVDREHIGIVGHSLGAVTAGRVAQIDARIVSAAALMAPMENPFVEGVTVAEIAKPLLFVVAAEDNSITEFGNQIMRKNYAAAVAPAWKLEIADAGHWSFSDLNGLVDKPIVGASSPFAAGCGNGIRQTDDQPFTYLDPSRGRELGAAYVTAFFRATLKNDSGATAYLQSSNGWQEVTSEHRR